MTGTLLTTTRDADMNRKNVALIAMGTLLTVAAFFYFPTDQYTRLPISFSSSKTPIIAVKIGNMDSNLKLDLGSKMELELDPNVLSQLQKHPKAPTTWKDAKGNCYETPSYILPRVEIGSFKYHQVSATEDSQEFHNNVLLWSGTQEQEEPVPHQGTIGRPLLKDKVLFLDFPSRAMVICSKLDQLVREKISPRNWHKIPLQISRFGIILSIETDLGPKRFVLDTGCTVSLIRTPQLEELSLGEQRYGMKTIVSSKFALDDEEFGPKRLYLFDITSEVSEIDGILGMDFLSEHRIVLDLPHQMAYIEPVGK